MPSSSIRWDCSPYSGAAGAELERELAVSPTVAAILARRGYGSVPSAERFLRADEHHDPFAFAGIEAACELILNHVARGSRILVHGDYDVDGVCSTSILVRALRRLGADPAWRLPSRFDGGYGLSVATVEELATAGADLLIAVDCGITSAPEIDAARALGVDTVVVDHHRPSERLPECPIVHPTVCGYPFGDLCAAGVALKLAGALDATAGEDPARAEDADLDLAALATVADLVSLTGENRRIVRQGLRAIARTDKPGLRALMAVASVNPGALDARAIGFRLAPRLNAAGRVGRADSALELLLTEDLDRAEAVAAELDEVNGARRAAEERILVAAEVARAEAPDAPALVLAGEGWHPGVIGIVASRMVERHHRPCVLVALEGEAGRGSGRSIPAFDLHAGLTACAGHLRRYGGHRAAAGLEIDAGNLDAFRDAFLDHARATLSEDDLVPAERVDAVVPATALGLELAEELERLGPFGQGNPCPTLLVPAAHMSDLRGMGEEEAHTALTLSSGGARARVVAFGATPGSLRECVEEPHDVAASLELNEWNGAVEPRLLLRALRPSEEGGCEVVGEEPLLEALVRELEGPPLTLAPERDEPARVLSDRRGEGTAGVLGDAVSTGERVLVVCAEVGRRRAALERLLGGLARALRGVGGGNETTADDCDGLALASWASLEREPRLAARFEHLVALDPPPRRAGERLLATAPAPPAGDRARDPASGRSRPPAGGRSYAAWGRAEVDFALRAAAAAFDLRAPLAAVYRALRDHGGALGGSSLERALRGEGDRPRPPEVGVRLVRVLVEVGLVDFVANASGGPQCRLTSAEPVKLEQSPTYRASLARLEEAQTYLERWALRPTLDVERPSTLDHDTAAQERAERPAEQRELDLAAA